MKIFIPHKNKTVLIDNNFYHLINKYHWWIHTCSGIDYVVCKLRIGKGKYCRIKLHHCVIGYPLNGKVIDHINRSGLDNRLKNLRVVTIQENCMNRGKRKNKTSKYLGVHWCTRSKRWIAQISRIGIHKRIGSFTNEYTAYLAYRKELNRYE